MTEETSEFAVFGEQKNFARPVLHISAGSFATVNSKTLECGGWISCREQFHAYTGDLKEMLFCHKAGKGKNVAFFIRKFEQKLGHTKLTLCGPTNYSRAMWIKPAIFWRRNDMRRSLFTALLRAGQEYDIEKDNFDEALNSEAYLRQTRHAIDRFLKGYTWYTGHANGWRDQFQNAKDEKVLAKLLTKKPIKDSDLFDYALAKLKLTKEELESAYRKEKCPLKKAPSSPAPKKKQ